jgi:ABC-type glutathione transport system ATPase component
MERAMSPDHTSVLEISGLDVTYGHGHRRRQVLFDVALRVRPGEAVGVIGESGSGKTTLARTALGLVRPSAGAIRIDGTDTVGLSAAQRRRLRRAGTVQYVFQDPLKSLDPELTLGASLAEPLRIRGTESGEAVRRRVRELLDTVDLDPALADRFPSEVSGGQRQRVAIARALITDPKLIILDEPVSALDSANRAKVLNLLGALRDRGVALVFISHDLGSVAGLTDRTAVLFRGHVVEEAPTADIVNRPRHPYTRLLVGSAPTLAGASIDRDERSELRALLTPAPTAE